MANLAKRDSSQTRNMFSGRKGVASKSGNEANH